MRDRLIARDQVKRLSFGGDHRRQFSSARVGRGVHPSDRQLEQQYRSRLGAHVATRTRESESKAIVVQIVKEREKGEREIEGRLRLEREKTSRREGEANSTRERRTGEGKRSEKQNIRNASEEMVVKEREREKRGDRMR